MGMVAYRYDIRTHGPSVIEYLRIQVDVYFEPKTATPMFPLLSAIDVGNTFRFYVINDCNVNVFAVLQPAAMVKLAGETRPREIQLKQTKLTDPMMVFFPSPTKWAIGDPCEGR